jgi:dihydrofolate reductase
MGRVVVTEFVSVDGVIQAPGDPSEYERGGWATGGGQAGNQFKFDELMASDAQLLGRVTYEGLPGRGRPSRAPACSARR